MSVLKLHHQLLRDNKGAFVGYKKVEGKLLPVFADLESAVALIGPPRSGKSTKILAQSIACFPGLVVATTCRGIHSRNDDIIELTKRPREQIAQATGGQVVELGVDPGMKPFVKRVSWDILSGCSNWETAKERAESIAYATIDSEKGLKNQDVYIQYVSFILSGLFYQFALENKSIKVLTDIVLGSPQERLKVFITTVRNFFLENSRISSYKEAGQLLNTVLGLGNESFENIITQLRSSLQSLEVTSTNNISIEELLKGHSTIYIQASATPSRARKTAPIVATFIEELVNTYKNRHKDDRPNAILLALDEVVNVAPIRTLPNLLRTGGGEGIQTVIALQDTTSAKAKWPQDDLVVNCKQVLFSGLRDYDYLKRVSDFSGQYLGEEYTYEFPEDLRGIPIELLESYLSEKLKLGKTVGSDFNFSAKDLDFDYRSRLLDYGIRWDDFVAVFSKVKRHRQTCYFPKYSLEQLVDFEKNQVIVIDGSRIEKFIVPFYWDVPTWCDDIFQINR